MTADLDIYKLQEIKEVKIKETRNANTRSREKEDRSYSKLQFFKDFVKHQRKRP